MANCAWANSAMAVTLGFRQVVKPSQPFESLIRLALTPALKNRHFSKAVPFSRAAPTSLVNTSAPAPSVASSAASALPVDSVDRLQAELIELRRTVARLEEGRR